MTKQKIVRSIENLTFGLTIFLSAFLLFQIQPMISKFILPWFGGGPAVWTASMLFFQVLLLGGYAYAHSLSGQALQKQGGLHLAVLAAALLWIVFTTFTRQTPITPDPRLKPDDVGMPVFRVLGVLVASVGLPYFLLSTTSSLLQSWFREAQGESSPYGLYALSNAASFLALLSYPILFEPAWTIQQQAVFWSAGFVLYLLLIGLSAARMLRSGRRNSPAAVLSDIRNGFEPAAEAAPGAVDCEPAARPTRRDYLFWASLAACPSVMLLATTNQITQDIASVPFLWVLPLSLYLLSFIAAFNDRLVNMRWLYVLLILPALYLGYTDLQNASQVGLVTRISTNALLLLIVCLFCHAELYARRPHPRFLTSFYLLVSIGGAAGGIFVSLVAPLIFIDFWEYQLGLVFCAVLATVLVFQNRRSWLFRLRLPFALAAMVLSGFVLSTPVQWIQGSAMMTRNFYGVLRVRALEVDGETGYSLVHGGILHGSQILAEPFRYRPTKYYTESTGVGLAYRNHPDYLAGNPMRTGVVGLGIGTMAAYGREGDTIRFYEIDPSVVEIANNPRYFTYLEDSQANVEIVLGDARLSMERELEEGQPQQYDLLAIDAFSSDSIPTHLINREVTALYLAHLDKDGILAYHISNRHINLEPVVALLAEEYGLDAAVMRGGGQDWLGTSSTWVLLSRDGEILNTPMIAVEKGQPEKKPGVRIWTDDYSNLFQVLRTGTVSFPWFDF